MPFDKTQDDEVVRSIIGEADLLQAKCAAAGIPFLINIVFQEDEQNYDAQTWGMNGGEVESSVLIDQLAFLQRHRHAIQALLKQCGNLATVHQRFAHEVAQVHQESDSEH